MLREYSFKNASYISGERLRRGNLGVRGDRCVLTATDGPCIDAGEDRLIYPALINVHDHLRGDYLPRVGPPIGRYYLNWSYWDADLKASRTYRERAAVSLRDSYLLGAYKNLLSGVVSVNDHFPHEFNAPFLKSLPLRAIDGYTLAHECSSFDLKWGDGIRVEHRRARRRDIPFITHLEEGFDRESQSGVDTLVELGCLDGHCVLIHCIGFSDNDIRTVRRAGSHVVWCPASNIFMFNLTCKVRKMLKAGVPISIGTDSTHTGSINLLEEMRYARRVYRELYGEELSAKTVYRMVSGNPARALRMADRIGDIADGMFADFLVTRRLHADPFESLMAVGLPDIDLVTMEGTPLYGHERYEELFRARGAEFSSVRLGRRAMLCRGDPAGLLARVRRAVGFAKKLDFLPLSL